MSELNPERVTLPETTRDAGIKGMNRNIYPLLSMALAFPLAHITAEPMQVFATDAINGTSLAPYQYRLLFAWIWYGMAQFLAPYMVSWLICFFCLALTAVIVDQIGRKYSNHERTQLFLIAAYAVLPTVVLAQALGAHWNLLEVVFFSAAFLMTLDGRRWALYPLVVVATFNRETAVFIPLLFWLVTRNWKHTAGMGIVWAVTYGAIRLIIGPIPVHVTLLDILAINTSTAGFARFVMGLPFLGWLFWYAWKGWKIAPAVMRRAGLVIPIYLAFILVFGVWNEWRLYISLYPVLVPLAGIKE